MAYRANVKDADQNAIESKTFSGGIPVFVDATTLLNADGTRVIAADGGAAFKQVGGVVVAQNAKGSEKDFGDQAGKRCDANGKPVL